MVIKIMFNHNININKIIYILFAVTAIITNFTFIYILIHNGAFFVLTLLMLGLPIIITLAPLAIIFLVLFNEKSIDIIIANLGLIILGLPNLYYVTKIYSACTSGYKYMKDESGSNYEILHLNDMFFVIGVIFILLIIYYLINNTIALIQRKSI